MLLIKGEEQYILQCVSQNKLMYSLMAGWMDCCPSLSSFLFLLRSLYTNGSKTKRCHETRTTSNSYRWEVRRSTIIYLYLMLNPCSLFSNSFVEQEAEKLTEAVDTCAGLSQTLEMLQQYVMHFTWSTHIGCSTCTLSRAWYNWDHTQPSPIQHCRHLGVGQHRQVPPVWRLFI